MNTKIHNNQLVGTMIYGNSRITLDLRVGDIQALFAAAANRNNGVDNCT